jgi:hypothetical protein
MAKYNELKVNTTRFNGSFPPSEHWDIFVSKL